MANKVDDQMSDECGEAGMRVIQLMDGLSYPEAASCLANAFAFVTMMVAPHDREKALTHFAEVVRVAQQIYATQDRPN